MNFMNVVAYVRSKSLPHAEHEVRLASIGHEDMKCFERISTN